MLSPADTRERRRAGRLQGAAAWTGLRATSGLGGPKAWRFWLGASPGLRRKRWCRPAGCAPTVTTARRYPNAFPGTPREPRELMGQRRWREALRGRTNRAWSLLGGHRPRRSWARAQKEDPESAERQLSSCSHRPSQVRTALAHIGSPVPL
jgi:hypothetical protein